MMGDSRSRKSGWKRVKFGDVVTLNKDRVPDPAAEGIERYVAIEHIKPQDLRIRSWGLVAEGTTFTNYFRPGQVLFVKRRAYQRKVALTDFSGVCSGDIYVLESKDPQVLLPELLPFICQTEGFFNHAVGTSAGSLSPRTNWKQLANYEFALPPLEEQRRTAKLLASYTEIENRYLQLDTRIESTVQAYADFAFDVKSARKFLEHKTSANAEKLRPLKEFCSFQVGYPFKSSEYVEDGDRLLRGSNITVGGFDWSEDKTKYWPVNRRGEFQDYVLKPGDIVIAMDRPFIGNGFKAAEISEEDLPALLLQRVGRFALSSEVDRNFLWCFLHSSSFMLQLLSQQQGMDLPHISKYDIEKAMIPTLPLTKQKSIGQLFKELENAGKQAKSRLLNISKLKMQAMDQVLMV